MIRSVRCALFAALVPIGAMHAQGDPMASGLIGGDYLRIAAGVTNPVNPQGSLRDWRRGPTVSVVWDNWGSGSSGVATAGFGFALDYGRLPLDEQQFRADFVPPEGGTISSAHASAAQVFSLTTDLRFRVPSPIVMPSFLIGLGFIDFRPSTVSYTAGSATGTATQKHRSGFLVNLGGGLDRQIVGATAIFAEAVYSYGFTSLGQGIARPGGTCASNGCDVLKNTSLGTIRGGLRVQLGR